MDFPYKKLDQLDVHYIIGLGQIALIHSSARLEDVKGVYDDLTCLFVGYFLLYFMDCNGVYIDPTVKLRDQSNLKKQKK